MNFVRRRPGNTNEREVPSGVRPECTHLGRLFNQYKQIQDYNEQEQMFYELLPLFHGVLADCQATEFIEKFPDVHSFCARAAQILVREVKVRAAKQTSEEGSRKIAMYLMPTENPCSGSDGVPSKQTSPLNVENRGWNLLLCLNLLSSGHTSLIECMVAASLPSTLVKCMYIFLDLPPTESNAANSFQPTFKQLLQRLCLYPITAEELARSDALCHLFSASADWCSMHNVVWRTTTASVLSTIAQNGLTPSVVKYIHDSKGIMECLKNISQGRSVPLEIVDSFVALLHVLRESFIVTHVLLDDFRLNNGYLIATEFILKLEQDSDTVETNQALRTLVGLVGRLVVCGAVELRPKPGAGEQIHVIPGFRVPMPKTGAKKSVRNVHAFDVLQSIFLSASSTELSLVILDTIRSIYLQDLSNYFILEQQNTLVVFAKKIFQKPAEVQDAFFSLLEVLANKLHYVPMKEISSIVVLLKTCNLTQCVAVAFRHLIRLVREHRTFKEVYHDVGLLELGVDLLCRFADTLDDVDNADRAKQDGRPSSGSSASVHPVAFEVGQLVLDFLRFTVTGSVANADLCIRLGTAECLVNRILSARAATALPTELRLSVLHILEELMLTNGGEDLMPSLLSKMHTTGVTLKVDILRSFCRVLRESHRCRIVFRKVNGFVYVVQELIYLEGCLADPAQRKVVVDNRHPPLQSSASSPRDDSVPLTRNQFLASLTYKQVFQLIRAIFTTLGIAMKFEPANAHYFATEVQYSNLTDALIGLGSFANDRTGEPNVAKPIKQSDGTESMTNCDYSYIAQNSPFHSLFKNIRLAETLLVDAPEAAKPGSTLPQTVNYSCSISFSDDEQPRQQQKLSRSLVECCVLARYLYDMAIDGYDKHSFYIVGTDLPTPASPTNSSSARPQSPTGAPYSSDLNPYFTPTSYPSIVHPGAIISILHLIAMLERNTVDEDQSAHNHHPNYSADMHGESLQLQFCLLDVIAHLFGSERNQQLMCSVAMPRELLTLFPGHLACELAPLHSRVQNLFESLVAQALTPHDLREFLRVSNPLCSRASALVEPTTDVGTDPLGEIASAIANARARHGGPIPLSQIKCLITTSTPSSAQIARPMVDSLSVGAGANLRNDIHARSDSSTSTDQTMSFAVVPPFVEFDMSPEGFGCLFLPSIAPQGPSSISNLSGATVTSDITSSAGGVGTGERVFPPPHGLTFSTWLCVLRFDRTRPHSAALPNDYAPVSRPRRGSSPNAPPHQPSLQHQISLSSQPQAVHLLTIVRGIQSVNDQLICLRIFIHPRTHMLVVSTQERLAQSDHVTDMDLISGEALPDYTTTACEPSPTTTASGASRGETEPVGSYAVFPCGLQQDPDSKEWPVGVWRHLAVVFSRAGMIKSSSCSVYLDGRLVGVQRLNYIGTSAASSGFLGRQTMPSSVCAFVGTPASMRRPSDLVWRQGPMHLVEEPLSHNRIAYIARLGPNYTGSFQSPPPVSSDVSAGSPEAYHPLFGEEKLVFGIYASTMSTLTLSLIRKVYNQADAKAIARQFYIAPKENATPIRLLHNSAAHLQGPARPLGAVLVGYQGVRAFAPCPVVRQLHCIGGGAGGVRIGLALVAMARDVETLYAATKAACTLIKCSPTAANEMRATRGYQMLAMLLRKKRSLLTTRILDTILSLTLSLESWIDTTHCLENTSPLDHPAFEDLMCDLDLWRVEVELPNGSDRNALCTQEPFDAKSSVTMESRCTPPLIEVDYRLVANMLNHLVELLNNETRRPLDDAGPISGSNDLRTRKSSCANEPIHPVWNTLFDRVIYMLMNAHGNPLTSTGSTNTQQDGSSSISVTVTNGRILLVEASMNFLYACLSHALLPKWLLRLGQLMAWTLPTPDLNESSVVLEQLSLCNELHSAEILEWQQQLIVLRNRCFQLILRLIVESPTINKTLCNELLTTLGFDWLHQFLRPAVHSSTVILALHLLVLLVLNPAYSVVRSNPSEDWSNGFLTLTTASTKIHRPSKASIDGTNVTDGSTQSTTDSDGLAAYRVGCPAGRWLRGCETLLRRQHGLFLDTSIRQAKRASSRFVLALREFRLSTCQQPGFAMLQTLLPHHSNVPELFYILVALLLQFPIRHIPPDFKLEFDSLCAFSASHKTPVAFTQASVDSTCSVTDGNPLPTPALSSSPSSSTSGVSGLVSSFLSSAGLSVSHFGRRRTRTESASEAIAEAAAVTDSPAPHLPTKPGSVLCPEAATLLLCLIRPLINSEVGKPDTLTQQSATAWTREYPEVLLRFFIFLYQSKPLFRSIAINSEFINALVGLLPSAAQPVHTEQLDFSHQSVFKLAMEFLKTIVTDGFLMPPSSHQPIHLVDTLLDVWSDNCGSKQHQELQTRLLVELMDHFVAIDVLDHRSIPVPPGGDPIHLPPNLVYFSSRIVDRLWQGCFPGEALRVIDFLIYCIDHWHNRAFMVNTLGQPSAGGDLERFSLNSLYRSLNRAVLYQLSRPILTRSDQLQMIEVFTRLANPSIKQSQTKGNSCNPSTYSLSTLAAELNVSGSSRAGSLLFSDANEDPEFPACLVHLLMQLVRTDRYEPTSGVVPRPRSFLLQPTSPSRTVRSQFSPKARENSPDVQPLNESNTHNYYHTTFGVDELASDVEENSGALAENRSAAKRAGIRRRHTHSSSTSPSSRHSPVVCTPKVTESTHAADPTALTSTNFEAIVQGALKLWSECYLAKKQILAQIVPESPLISGLSVPTLKDWAPVLESPCLMAWAQHVDSEAAGLGGIGPELYWGRIPGPPMPTAATTCDAVASTATPAPATSGAPPGLGLHHQFSFRLSKLPTSMFRLGSVPSPSPSVDTTSSSVHSNALPGTTGAQGSISAPQKNFPVHRYRSLSPASNHMNVLENARDAVHTWMPMQLNSLREFMEQQKRQYNRNMCFIQRQLELEWEKVEQELTRERGLWGPIDPDPLVRWKLDATEGPCRMRKRMIPNLSFYARYPYHPWGSKRLALGSNSAPTSTGSIPLVLKCRQPRSRYSRLHFLNCRSHSILREDWGPLTTWLPLLEKDQKRKPSRPLSCLLQAELVDSEQTEMITPDGVQIETSSPKSSEVFDGSPLRQSLNPEEMEQSLQETASLLRRASKNQSMTDLPVTDDLDELIASATPTEPVEDTEDRSVAIDTGSAPSHSLSETSPGASVDTADGTLAPQPPTAGSPELNKLYSTSQQYASVVVDEEEQLASHEAILRLLEPGERPAFMYRCARVFGLDVYEGLLLFGRNHFYVIDGYTLINTREIVDIDSLPPDIIHEPIVPCIPSHSQVKTMQQSLDCHRGTPNNRSRHSKSYLTDLWSTGAVSQTSGKQYFKFPYENIQDVYKRRYLLQPIALEVFNTDGRNFLLVFSRGLQGKVYQRFQDVAAGHSTASSQALLGQKSSHGLFSSFLGERTVTQRWERGELSNFQYLMYLNTQAGRSYNDLMQYPIFPWVLADYDSEELDLSRPETFRDLSKPMGAQTARRLSQFERRYKEWDDPSGETPPYHYGTHYSSAMIVASYLVRIEPFTQQFLRLQGGHFDLPDRMFYSVKDAWLSASQHNMADVRELIPEFFYLPDFLVNSNGFELGTKQNGVEVDDVTLPPWAKSDPREFIRAHREALESEYVSAHLHEWIDLIFGCKQQGDSAVQACNVFHHLFYEGNVDIYSIDDPLRRSAVIGFINNFGQIPKQLFRKPHPSRRVAIPRAPIVTASLYMSGSGRRNSGSQLAVDLFYRNLGCLRPHMQPLKELKHAVGQIMQPDPSLIPNGVGVIGSSGVIVNTASSTTGGVIGPILGSNAAGGGGVFSDCNTPNATLVASSPAVAGGSALSGGPIVAVEQNKCLLPPSYAFYVAWGFTDGSLRLGNVFDPADRARCVFEMVDPSEILCCTAPNQRTLVTAGISTVVRVWKIQPVDYSSPDGSIGASGVGPGIASGTGAGGGSNVGGSSISGGNTSSGTANSSSSSQTASGYCLRLRANLCGHTEAVTCLAASNAFNLVVSGSRDRTCILWDLTRLCFLRQLVGHTAPVAAVAINEATGDIATCGGTYLHLWNCNGEPVASVDALAGRNKQLLCVCMSTLYDWDADNVILTGGSDGVVRMWSLDYSRVQNTSTTVEKCKSSGDRQLSAAAPSSPSESGDNVVHNGHQKDLQSQSTPSDSCAVNHHSSPASRGRWERQLTFRGKLTMHTAYGRTDNQQPAAITAMAISRDHRSVLVGDSRGRVHAWSVPPEAARGGMTDQWIRDEGATKCAADGCGVRFSLTERKHHCRNCGKVFCSKCSRFEIEIYRLRLFKRVRVCQNCFALLKVIQAPKPNLQSDQSAVPTSQSSPSRS